MLDVTFKDNLSYYRSDPPLCLRPRSAPTKSPRTRLISRQAVYDQNSAFMICSNDHGQEAGKTSSGIDVSRAAAMMASP